MNNTHDGWPTRLISEPDRPSLMRTHVWHATTLAGQRQSLRPSRFEDAIINPIPIDPSFGFAILRGGGACDLLLWAQAGNGQRATGNGRWTTASDWEGLGGPPRPVFNPEAISAIRGGVPSSNAEVQPGREFWWWSQVPAQI
jgi:hypothetical protein